MTALATRSTQSPAVLIDAARLAEILNCSRRHVEQMDCTGKLPRPIRLGRLKKFLLLEVEAWLSAGAPCRDQWDRIRTEHLEAAGNRVA
jgi:predicted DNA-binding transcriptional regulator AlpA